MSRYPLVTWAQRLDKLFITMELADAKNVKLYLDAEGKLFFSANSGAENTLYMIDIDLYDKVDINESRARYTPRKILYVVKKAESKWWCRLLIQEGKPPVFLKVDWDKWVDVDEDDEKSGGDMDSSNFDFLKLNKGGAGDFDMEAADEDEDVERDKAASVNCGPSSAPAVGESVARA